jgi:hypothetical protein
LEGFTMADIVTAVANKCGIRPELARAGLSIVLSFLKKKLPPDTFAQISAVVPESEGLTTAAPAGTQESGGLLGAAAGMAGKLLGGEAGGGGELVGQLSQAGFSPDQLGRFLPTAAGELKDRVPGDVMSKIGALIPGT